YPYQVGRFEHDVERRNSLKRAAHARLGCRMGGNHNLDGILRLMRMLQERFHRDFLIAQDRSDIGQYAGAINDGKAQRIPRAQLLDRQKRPWLELCYGYSEWRIMRAARDIHNVRHHSGSGSARSGAHALKYNATDDVALDDHPVIRIPHAA